MNLDTLNPVIIITGDDYLLAKEMIDQIVNLLPQGYKDIDLVIASDNNLSDTLFDCNNLAFISSKRIVLLAGRTAAITQEEKKSLSEYIIKPSDSTILLIHDSNNIFKDYYKKARHYELNRLSMSEVIKRIEAICSLNNIKIDRTASALIAEYTDRFMSRAAIETHKLISYAYDKGYIDINDVKECVIPETDYAIYKFVNALIKGKGTEAIEASETLLNSGMPPIVMLSSIINQYRKLLHISLAGNRKDEEVATLLKAPLFSINKDKQQLKAYTQRQLKAIMDKLYDLEYSFKSGKLTDEQALKAAISILLVRGMNNAG